MKKCLQSPRYILEKIDQLGRTNHGQQNAGFGAVAFLKEQVLTKCAFSLFIRLSQERRKSQCRKLLRSPDTVSTPPPTPVAFTSPFVQRALAAFFYRDFRVLWFGAFASTVGTWMQKVAQSWLVFDLTKSSDES